jgi:mono/diheme cytochrome c family protein
LTFPPLEGAREEKPVRGIMRTNQIVYIAVGIAVAAAIGSWRYFDVDQPTFADAGDVALVARGGEVYAEHCAACHGKDLKGQPNWRQRRPDGRLTAPPHDQTGHTWHHTDELLFQITKHGSISVGGPDYKTDMAAFGEALSDAEIWAALAYIKSRWPVSVRRRHAEIDKRGK